MTVEESPEYRLLCARALYARQLLAKAGLCDSPRLMKAFSAVSREKFLGAPPWYFRDVGNYRELASADPAVLYQDLVVGLETTRGINNGMPSLHASALHHIGIREGETVAHMGAGTGYYTAIIAQLVGPSGKVIAVEYDAVLADKAKRHLEDCPQVEVVHGSALEFPVDDADVIYANFALDHPPRKWVDNLAPGGRLVFPFGIPALEGDKSAGFSRWAAMLKIDRWASGFGAKFLQPVSFIWGEGQEPAPEGRHERLAEAFRSRRLFQVRSFRWGQEATGGEWYGEDGWGLSFTEV